MVTENKITLLNEEFENEKTGEKIQGITVIVDGKLKEVMDILITQNRYDNYTEIVKEALFEGINVMITKR